MTSIPATLFAAQKFYGYFKLFILQKYYKKKAHCYKESQQPFTFNK